MKKDLLLERIMKLKRQYGSLSPAFLRRKLRLDWDLALKIIKKLNLNET